MRKTPKETANTRDIIHNLDPIEDKELVMQQMIDFIADAEGFEEKVYNDNPKNPKRGNDTIGFGFNMDQKDARKFWDAFLPDVSFDDTKAGKIKITRDQGKLLMQCMIKVKIQRASQEADPKLEREKHFGPEFHSLRPNIQLFIIDHYYHGDSFIMPRGKGHEDLKNYIETGNNKYVESLIEKIKNKPTDENAPGKKVRDQRRVVMLNSAATPLPADPLGPGIPSGKTMKAKIKETIVPRGMLDKYPTTQKNKDYFVWRTQLDGKVRSDHQKLEGKIFPKGYRDHNMHNCRCFEQDVPGNVIIDKDNEEEIKGALNRLYINTRILLKLRGYNY